MLHFHRQNNKAEITCDCGEMSFSFVVRIRVPARVFRCPHCGESATTAELLARENMPVPAPQPEKKGNGLVFRISASLMGIGRRTSASQA